MLIPHMPLGLGLGSRFNLSVKDVKALSQRFFDSLAQALFLEAHDVN